MKQMIKEAVNMLIFGFSILIFSYVLISFCIYGFSAKALFRTNNYRAFIVNDDSVDIYDFYLYMETDGKYLIYNKADKLVRTLEKRDGVRIMDLKESK